MRVIVTGAAGFIGFHLSAALARAGARVLAIDNLNAYYDVSLKEARLAELSRIGDVAFERLDIADAPALARLTAAFGPERIAHLAAQAGVRYSIENPMAYAASNLTGHLSVLEAARRTPGLAQVLYASSSSVYGDRAGPFRETDPVDHPVSLYAATKRSGELMSETYAHLYGLTLTGLRFFTVYGPWGRPDMAYWTFADAILSGRPITLFNHGALSRDFTYVDDVVETLVRMLQSDPHTGHRIYNIGNCQPVTLARFVAALEAALGRPATRILADMQPGDVTTTFADVSALARDYAYRPSTPIEEGLTRFAAWFTAWRERASAPAPSHG